jgi:AcrR family transcriptional regulator
MVDDPVLTNRRRGAAADGRRQRSERTRQLIIEAYGALGKGVRTPTASQIAEQAGYSVRSIFERFTDLRALSLATADHAIVVGQTESEARDVDGDRHPARIKSHVKTRALACEKWLPLWRALLETQDELAELKTRVMLVRLANLERLKLMYGPELAILPDTERQQLLFALGALTSFESWDQLRNSYGLTMEKAQDIWRAAIDRMLPTR